MNLFNSRAPGVEWNPQDEPEDTLRIANEPTLDPYPTACLACQGEIGFDGYCLQCGEKAKNLRERYDLSPTDWVSGVCDIGQVHIRNEDALACLGDACRAVLVVCDGVTTSEDSDVASMAAARTACEQLWTNNPQGVGTQSSRTAAVYGTLTKAVLAANQAVIDKTDPHSLNSAASTIAIAIIDSNAVFCANLGDSRVYWLPDSGEPALLTKDHSLAQVDIEAGTKRAEAESSPFAHTITRWLGLDAVELDPFLASQELEQPGWILVCSDGLWNYASEAKALAAIVGSIEDPSPEQLATRLVAWANEQGGHDNITVAVARFSERISEAEDQGVALSSTDNFLDQDSIPTQPVSAD